MTRNKNETHFLRVLTEVLLKSCPVEPVVSKEAIQQPVSGGEAEWGDLRLLLPMLIRAFLVLHNICVGNVVVISWVKKAQAVSRRFSGTQSFPFCMVPSLYICHRWTFLAHVSQCLNGGTLYVGQRRHRHGVECWLLEIALLSKSQALLLGRGLWGRCCLNSKVLFCTDRKYWYYSERQNTARVYRVSKQSSACRKFSSFEEQFTLWSANKSCSLE